MENAIDSSQNQNMRCFDRLLSSMLGHPCCTVLPHLLYCFVVDHSRQTCEFIYHGWLSVRLKLTSSHQDNLRQLLWLFRILRLPPMVLSFSFNQSRCILALCGYNQMLCIIALHVSFFLQVFLILKECPSLNDPLVMYFVRSVRPNSTTTTSHSQIICRIGVRALQCRYRIQPIGSVSYLHLDFFESLIISFFVSIAYFGRDRANNDFDSLRRLHLSFSIPS